MTGQVWEHRKAGPMEKNPSPKSSGFTPIDVKTKGKTALEVSLHTLGELSEKARQGLERVIPDSLVVRLLMILGVACIVFFGSFFFINGQLGLGLTVVGWAEVIAVFISFLACFLPKTILPKQYRELRLGDSAYFQRVRESRLLTWVTGIPKLAWAQKIITRVFDAFYALRFVQVAGFLGMSFLLDGDGIGRFTVLGIVGGLLAFAVFVWIRQITWLAKLLAMVAGVLAGAIWFEAAISYTELEFTIRDADPHTTWISTDIGASGALDEGEIVNNTDLRFLGKFKAREMQSGLNQFKRHEVRAYGGVIYWYVPSFGRRRELVWYQPADAERGWFVFRYFRMLGFGTTPDYSVYEKDSSSIDQE